MHDLAKKRRTEDLYRGRASLPQARYFLTFCTAGRKPGLTQLRTAELFSAMENLEQAGDLKNYCATAMPDHIHWLFQLGERLTLGRVAARWKSATRKLLATHNLEWQRDFFERRVRAEERLEAYGLYIFLNPYRKGLISMNESWSHWRVWFPAIFEFTRQTHEGDLPRPEWLSQCHERPWAVAKRAQQDCAPTSK